MGRRSDDSHDANAIAGARRVGGAAADQPKRTSEAVRVVLSPVRASLGSGLSSLLSSHAVVIFSGRRPSSPSQTIIAYSLLDAHEQDQHPSETTCGRTRSSSDCG